MKNKEKEIWGKIPNDKSSNEVSNFGRIRSYNKILGQFVIRKSAYKNGYKAINIKLENTGKYFCFLLHRVVAILFIDNPNNYPCVLHIDNNKKNAHYKNLKWGTDKQNVQDAFRDGLVKIKGVQRRKSNLTEKDVMDIFKSKETCRALAKVYSVNHTCIVDIRSGRSWNHITGLLCTRKIKPKFSKDIKFIDD